MPVHDWTRVNAGTFHDFHSAWITHIKEKLNEGLLPKGFYAMSEQHFGKMIADVLTLRVGDPLDTTTPATGVPQAVAVAEAPPRVHRKMAAAAQIVLRKTLTVRRAQDHRVVALLEVVSPGNKDRSSSVSEFVKKVWSALEFGVHVLVINLFPPATFDMNGIHGEIWRDCEPEPYSLPPEQPLTMASYVASPCPEAYIEHVAVDDTLIDMPLFLDRDWYINIPLEETYQAAWRGVPSVWRDVIAGQH